MSITEHFDENALLFECRIRLTELASEQDLDEALEEYAEAIDRIANHFHNDRIWYFGITISLKRGLVKVLAINNALRISRAIVKDRKSWCGRNSWKSLCPEFWLVTYQFPSLRHKLRSIVEKIEQLLVMAKSAGRSTGSLWEDDQTQFGEPLISLLAIHDISFVDNYRLIMNQWDMDHEFQQFEIINAIVHIHGMGNETEELLNDRFLVSAGQNGESQIEELYPLLQEVYGDFTHSRLFERIIAGRHSIDMHDRQDALQEYEQLILKNPEAKPRPRNEPPFYYSENSDLKLGAKRIFVNLDKSHPLFNFL